MSAIEYTLESDVAVIAMDDGKANAMNPDMIAAVNEGLDRAEQEAGAVLLMGRNGVFCGGFDLNIIRSGDVKAQVEMTTAGAHLALRFYGFPKPVVIAATGHAIALGGFLLLAADHRIGITGDFNVGLNEVAIGMSLPPFALMLARARLDNRFLTGSALNASIYTHEQAVNAGFLDEVVSPAKLCAQAMQKAETLASLDPGAFSQVKQDLRGADIQSVLVQMGR